MYQFGDLVLITVRHPDFDPQRAAHLGRVLGVLEGVFEVRTLDFKVFALTPAQLQPVVDVLLSAQFEAVERARAALLELRGRENTMNGG